MKDQKSQRGSAEHGMEITVCERERENWKLPSGNTRVFKPNPGAAKVAFAGPKPLNRNEDRKPQRASVFHSPVRRRLFLSHFSDTVNPLPFIATVCSTSHLIQPWIFFHRAAAQAVAAHLVFVSRSLILPQFHQLYGISQARSLISHHWVSSLV